jgi:hypothetical protein
MRRLLLLGLVFGTTFAATYASGAVLRVPVEYSSIQSAINAAVHGDVVRVSPGEYEENISFSGKNVVLTSLDPNDPNVVAETIIYREPERSRRGFAVGAEGNGSIVTFMGGETEEAMLTGFTIKYGYGSDLGNNQYFGGGVLCVEASPTITKNTICNNLGANNEGRQGARNCFGAAICCLNSHASITHNTMTENSSYVGAGICCIESDAFVAYNRVSLNEAYIGAGVICLDGPTLVFSNLIIDNTAEICGGVYLRGGNLLNNTLIHNTATDICGHLFLDMQQAPGLEPQPLHIANNIFYDARAGGIIIQGDQTMGISFIHNSLFKNSPGDFISSLSGEPYNAFPEQMGNIAEDPLFIDEALGNYRLQDDSLCIDAGDPAFEPNATWLDMDGNPRVSGVAVDMGMFEDTRCTSPVAHAGSDQVVLIGQEVILDGTASAFCDPNQLQMFIWDQSAGPSARLSNPRAQQPSFSPELAGEYRFELMVFDGKNVSRADEVHITVLSEMPDGITIETGEAFDLNQGL